MSTAPAFPLIFSVRQTTSTTSPTSGDAIAELGRRRELLVGNSTRAEPAATVMAKTTANSFQQQHATNLLAASSDRHSPLFPGAVQRSSGIYASTFTINDGRSSPSTHHRRRRRSPEKEEDTTTDHYATTINSMATPSAAELAVGDTIGGACYPQPLFTTTACQKSPDMEENTAVNHRC
nr:hypothetical protein Itr_chr02CG11690 [Ipomoea trifida]